MNSFISFFKNTPGFTLSLILILGIEGFVGLFPKMDYIDPTGVFYTTLKRKIAETPHHFDFIMLGDSRSLSIKGKHSIEGSPSFYNFSLPAAGTRYLVYFMDKYLEKNRTPKAVLFAIDPEQFKPSQTKAFHIDPKIWQIFKHRLLNLFSLAENMRQYEGREAYFIFKESFSILIPTVRHREGLSKMLTGMKLEDIRTGNFPYYRSNLRLEALTQETQGQVNLGTYLEIPPGITEDMIRENVRRSADSLNKQEPDLQTLDHFIDYARSKGFPIVLLEIPHAEGYATTKFYNLVREGYRKRAQEYEHVHFFEFPSHSYPLNHYAEGIHFNEKGEERVNREFDEYIWKEVLKLFP